jgi:transcriptional regulator with XRE-family HTH domain
MSNASEEAIFEGAGGLGEDVQASLEEMIPDTPEVRRAGKEEAIRLMLTDVMRKVRKDESLSQAEVAERLGVTQSWVSKLESANHDHQIESVGRYLDALGAELRLSIRTRHGDVRLVNYERLLDGRNRYNNQHKPHPEVAGDTRYIAANGTDYACANAV